MNRKVGQLILFFLKKDLTELLIQLCNLVYPKCTYQGNSTHNGLVFTYNETQQAEGLFFSMPNPDSEVLS